MLLRAADSLLMVVDIQEKLAPAIHEGRAAIRNNAKLLTAAPVLDVPVVVTEQYVKGLGPTVADLQALTVNALKFEKIHFSAMREAAIVEAVRSSTRRQIVLTGMETHVCVLQTAFGLLAAGLDVFLVADAASSRRPDDKAAALDRLARAGAQIVTTEMVLFEWLERADSAAFRSILPLIR